MALFVWMRPGVLVVPLFVFVLLRLHGLTMQLCVLLGKAVLLFAHCLRLLFLLLQLRDPCLLLHVHAGRFFRGWGGVIERWRMCLRVRLHQMRRVWRRLLYAFVLLLGSMVVLHARVLIHGLGRHGRGSSG
ncbi:hypothetical protein [Xanthomonas albilineans]|uniref:hypothetical protein n=1 Tax=Xanthomonas albilineans TaxID=29447 RepID=UPI0005F30DAE|nr:hypothetical protein [Xanthomonas albilineans]